MTNFNIRKILVYSLLPLVLLVTATLLFPFSSRTDTYNDLELFSEVVNLVETRYVENVEVEKLMNGAYKGLLEGVDRYSSYLSARDYEEAKKSRQRGYMGVHVVKTGDYAFVAGVRKGSPAYLSGLRTGDFIRSVGGKSTRDMTLFQTTTLLESPPGTTVEIVVWNKNYSEETISITTKEEPKFKLVKEKHPEGVVLKIDSFFNGLTGQLSNFLQSSDLLTTKKIIIDLRQCFDGEREEALSAADLFISKGILAKLKKGSSQSSRKADSRGFDCSNKIIFLISHSTAGAAELFIASVSDNCKTSVIGETSFGKGFFQEYIPLKNGAALLVSTVEVMHSNGNPIEGEGIKPEMEVTDNAETADDEVLIKAFELASKDRAA